MARGRETAALVQDELDTAEPGRPRGLDGLARRQAHAAVLLLQLEDWDSRRGPLDQSEHIRADRIWPLFRDSPDPRLHSLRSYLIHRFARVGVDPDVLLRRYAAEGDVSARRALLLSLGEFDPRLNCPRTRGSRWSNGCRQTYRDDDDPGIHSAIDWLLRHRWGHGEQLDEIDRELAGRDAGSAATGTSRSSQGHTLAVIRDPAEFTMGSPEGEPDRRSDEEPHRRRHPAILRHRHQGGDGPAVPRIPEGQPRHPARLGADREAQPGPGRPGPRRDLVRGGRSIAAGSANRRALPEDQMVLPAGLPRSRTGCACRPIAYHGPATGCRPRRSGSTPAGPGPSRAAPTAAATTCWTTTAGTPATPAAGPARVGSLKPNDLGLFDMLGNAWEWCHDARAPYRPGPAEDQEQPGPVTAAQERVLRGGGFFSAASDLRSARRIGVHPQASSSLAGFRVARTLALNPGRPEVRSQGSAAAVRGQGSGVAWVGGVP